MCAGNEAQSDQKQGKALQWEKASPCIPTLCKNNEGDEPSERFVEKIENKKYPINYQENKNIQEIFSCFIEEIWKIKALGYSLQLIWNGEN